MSKNRPSFEKKELALSGSPYFYLPVEFPVYTIEVSHREEIDGDLLQSALDRTIQRMPYLSDTLAIDHGAVYYAKDPLPMEAAHAPQLRAVGGSETNYHMLDLTWDGNKTWFSMFHGFCDGQGINAFLESVLYHYYCLKDGVEYDDAGIRTNQTRMTEAETFEPCSKMYEVSPDFKMPERREQAAPYHLPEIVRNPDGDVREHGFHLPSDALMRFVKENNTSPSVMIAMLVGEAVERVHPDADAPIQANIPVSIRRMLGCEETFKNCSSRVMLPVSGTPLDALPFAQRATQLRGVLKQQMNPDLFRFVYNRMGVMYRERMEKAADYREEISKPAAFMGTVHDTYYVDYIGSLHKTDYADRILDVRFLCKPAASNTLHLNIIEHNGQFCITCLACSDIASLADALEQAMKEHGLPVQRTPEQRFALPMTAWREGIC